MGTAAGFKQPHPSLRLPAGSPMSVGFKQAHPVLRLQAGSPSSEACELTQVRKERLSSYMCTLRGVTCSQVTFQHMSNRGLLQLMPAQMSDVGVYGPRELAGVM